MAPAFLPTFENGLIPKELLSAAWCKCSIVLLQKARLKLPPRLPPALPKPLPSPRGASLSPSPSPAPTEPLCLHSHGPLLGKAPVALPCAGGWIRHQTCQDPLPGDVQLVGKGRSQQGKGPPSHLISPVSVLAMGQTKHQEMPPFPRKSLIHKCIKIPAASPL